MLQAQKLLRSFSDKRFNGVLIAKPVASGDGVVAVLVDRIIRLNHTGGAAFGSNRVTAHGINLRDHRDA